MSDITPKIEIDISKELANLQLYKHHPNGILDASLNRLKDMLDGRVEIVDPSNPFTYLLESTCINTAFAIQEMTLLTRKLYPRLANEEEDIYLHMSDVDYLDRFSSPSKTKVRFNVLFNSFRTNAYKDPNTGDYIHTIPKNFKVVINDYIFTLTAPIVIRLTSNDIIDVRYLGERKDDIFDLDTNFISFDTYALNQEETYVTFEADMYEIDLEAVEIPVEKSKLFKGKINYNQLREFYFFRAYHMVGGKWVEMITTHTDQVYDINTPTCIVKVNQSSKNLEYYIPPVYVNSGRLGSKVKFVTYTTLGVINVNFSDFKVGDFRTEYNPVFPETDLDKTTTAMNLIPKIVFIQGKVSGGKGPKSFNKLKADVIDNNLGKNHRPVTNVQIEHYLDGTNFKLVRDVDTVTNRIFLLEANLPESPSRYGVSKLNLGLVEYVSPIEELRQDKNSVVTINEHITILPEGTLFEIDIDGLKLLSIDEAEAIKVSSGNGLVKVANSRRLLSLYYHYVVDTSGDTTALRAYDISSPKVVRTNFKGFNPTARIGVNTINSNVIKSENGFQLDILANIKLYDEMYTESNLKPYLVHKDVSGSIFYLEGSLYTTIGDNPVYRFKLNSDYYVDSKHRLRVSNFRDSNGNPVSVFVDLESELEIIYLTNRVPTVFEASEMDYYIRGSYLSIDSAVVTLESCKFIFGYYLEYLYTRVHTSTGLEDYVFHEEDEFVLYDRNVYDSNNNIIHRRNETLLDDFGMPVIKHSRGEIKLDELGNPILARLADPVRYLNFLFIDYKATIANDVNLVEYRDYLKLYMTTMITDRVKDLQEPLLENTVAYMTVPANLDNVMIKYNDVTGYIPSSQSFRITLYVDRRTYEEVDIREGLEISLTKELEQYITKNKTLSKSVILSALLVKAGDFVKSISMDLFTEVNAEYIELMGEGAALSFNKTLSLEPDGYRLQDDVKFNFVLVS